MRNHSCEFLTSQAYNGFWGDRSLRRLKQVISEFELSPSHVELASREEIRSLDLDVCLPPECFAKAIIVFEAKDPESVSNGFVEHIRQNDPIGGG